MRVLGLSKDTFGHVAVMARTQCEVEVRFSPGGAVIAPFRPTLPAVIGRLVNSDVLLTFSPGLGRP
jgi:hypothetical protein